MENNSDLQRELQSLNCEKIVIDEEIERNKHSMANKIKNELNHIIVNNSYYVSPKPIKKPTLLRIREFINKISIIFGIKDDIG